MTEGHRDPPPPRGYLLHKAERYLAVGPTRYRRGDALGRPQVGLPRGVLAAVRRVFAGCSSHPDARARGFFSGLGVMSMTLAST